MHAGIHVKILFAPGRVQKHKASGKFNSTASERLTVLPIFVHYIQKVGVLLHATWSMPIDPSAIEETAEKGLQLRKAIPWKMIKKHHWLLHLGQAFRTHKIIVAFWSMERKHRFISRIAEAFTNTKHLEKGVLEEVAAKELNALGNAGTFATMDFQLKRPRKLPAKFAAMVKHL